MINKIQNIILFVIEIKQRCSIVNIANLPELLERFTFP